MTKTIISLNREKQEDFLMKWVVKTHRITAF